MVYRDGCASGDDIVDRLLLIVFLDFYAIIKFTEEAKVKRTMRILIVEDEPSIANFVCQGLTEAGYAVDVAWDGEEGLDYALVADYVVLILDIMLPKRDGLEVLKLIRENKRLAKKPVVILTNLGREGIIKEGFSLGADGYLIKSTLTPDQIVTEVKKYLSKA